MSNRPKPGMRFPIIGSVIGFYRERWLTRYGESTSCQDRLGEFLHVMEFRADGCDSDELSEAFIEANEGLERKAYGFGCQRHFGIGYLARNPHQDSGLIRAIVMVEPEAADNFTTTAEALSRPRSGLSVSKCEIDPHDPDAWWRWLADGIQASAAMLEHGDPRFVILGRDGAFESHAERCHRRRQAAQESTARVAVVP